MQEDLFQVNSVANENKQSVKKLCADNNISTSITVHGMRHTLASILIYE